MRPLFAALALAACARPGRGLVWQEVPRCAASAAEVEACAARGGELGRAPWCGGVAPPAPEPGEQRATERAYRRGEIACVCLTAADWEACKNTP